MRNNHREPTLLFQTANGNQMRAKNLPIQSVLGIYCLCPRYVRKIPQCGDVICLAFHCWYHAVVIIVLRFTVGY